MWRPQTNWLVISTSTWDLAPFLSGVMSNRMEKCVEASSPCGRTRQRHHLKARWCSARVIWPSCESLGTSNVAVLTFVGRRVPRYVHYNCECAVVRECKRTVPACYQCGTIGHRIDNCPHPDVTRCGYCGQRVGASEQGLAEHECTPSCMVCGEAHLTGSADCKGKFRRLQRPRTQQQGAPSNKTSKPADNGGASSGKSGKATGPATGNKAARENSAGNKTSSSMENKNRKTSGQSAKPPAFQEGDFPPLGNSKVAITCKVSNWAEIASTPSSSPSPLELELKK
ncbi:hypothetical protein HPB49_002907 [Dermacentor silvarum]|uniref:Uncharacterized protein n=1 Tax=Dermacentor silvarum TaxID=543639 RepID=A0ACB8D2G5_DERSI|nr:hypothetical protein HPB49_002907 [Dermacentor silvarum]